MKVVACLFVLLCSLVCAQAKCGKFVYGIDYYGADLEPAVRARNAGQCQQICTQHPKCIYFTYRLDNNECWLKKADGFTKVSEQNVISGKYCS